MTGARDQRAADRKPPVLRPGIRIFEVPEGRATVPPLQAMLNEANEFLSKVPLAQLLSHEVIVHEGRVVAIKVLYSYTPRDQRDERW